MGIGVESLKTGVHMENHNSAKVRFSENANTPGWVRDWNRRRGLSYARWTDAELDELKLALNRNGMSVVSDAIGSLQFDLIEVIYAPRGDRQ